jgi:hypothetical protein
MLLLFCKRLGRKANQVASKDNPIDWYELIGETVFSDNAKNKRTKGRLFSTKDGLFFDSTFKKYEFAWSKIRKIGAYSSQGEYALEVSETDSSNTMYFYFPENGSAANSVRKKISGVMEASKVATNPSTKITTTARLDRPSVEGAEKVASFFIASAWGTLVIGFVSALVSAWNATRDIHGAIPGSGGYFFEIFLIVFSGVCLGAATLAFFGYVLRLLKAILEK